MPFGQPKENLTRWYRWRGKFWRHDWARIAGRLGIWPDTLLAHELGCDRQTIGNMRRTLGIPPAREGRLLRELRALLQERRRLAKLQRELT